MKVIENLTQLFRREAQRSDFLGNIVLDFESAPLRFAAKQLCEFFNVLGVKVRPAKLDFDGEVT